MNKSTLFFVFLFFSVQSIVAQVQLTADIRPGSAESFPEDLTTYNNKLYFQANDGVNGRELWSYDGTTASLVADINPGSGNSSVNGLIVFNNMLYFSASNGVDGGELMVYDGTSVSLVADINPGTQGSGPDNFTIYNSKLYFQANDGVNGDELWSYDGTTTSLVANINPGGSNSIPNNLAVYNNKLYFQANDGVNGYELWSHDGTTTTLVADINPGSGSSNPQSLEVFNNKLYFGASDGVNGVELWSYDGTTVSMVADINPGSSSSFASNMKFYNNKLYFQANDGVNGKELWSYDGTIVSLVEDINPGSAPSSPQGLMVYNNKLFFNAADNSNGNELWSFDGSNVELIDDYNPGTPGSEPRYMTEFMGVLYFQATDFEMDVGGPGIHGYELCEYIDCEITFGVDIQAACNTFTWIDGNTYTASNNSATHTLTNAAGCDSIVTLDLTINFPTSGTDVQTACGSYAWIDGNTYSASTNTPTYTATSVLTGCDSIVTLDLTIISPSTGVDVQTSCGNFTWIDGNTYASSTNSPTFTISNGAASGCDSIVTLDLTILPPVLGTDIQTACGSFTWIDGNTYGSSTNSPTYTISNGAANGCDSIVTLNLTITSPSTGVDVQTSCGIFTWIDGNTYASNTNTPTYTIVDGGANGCDSIVTLDLTINNSNTGVDVQTACDSYTWIDGNTYTSSNNTATHTLTNVAGCDSVVTLNLTIDSGLDLNVTLAVNSDNDVVLTAEDANAQYQWLDCNDGYAVINGANNQTYVVAENGSYAVQLTENGCVDTSDCIVVNNVSIPKNEKSQIKIYPNPSNGTFTLESDLIGKSYTIIDAQGRLVQSGLIENQNATIKLENEQVGVYYLKVENRVLKLIKH